MSKFTPVSEEEYKQKNCWKPGWYPAEIIDCVEKQSQASGSLMFETKFQIFNDDGKSHFVTSYVMAEGKAAFQLRACAEAFGVLDQYHAGELTEDDLKGKTGYVKLAIQSDPNGVYDDKNVIRDFKKTVPGKITVADIQKPTTTETASKSLDDDIPF